MSAWPEYSYINGAGEWDNFGRYWPDAKLDTQHFIDVYKGYILQGVGSVECAKRTIAALQDEKDGQLITGFFGPNSQPKENWAYKVLRDDGKVCPICGKKLDGTGVADSHGSHLCSNCITGHDIQNSNVLFALNFMIKWLSANADEKLLNKFIDFLYTLRGER